MAQYQKDTSYNPFTLNRKSWSKLAVNYKRHVAIIEHLLERGSGCALDGGQLYAESRGILAFLLQEVEGFDKMSHAEIAKTAHAFILAYLDFRDENEHPWIGDIEAPSGLFEQSFIRIARLAKNRVNQKKTPKPPQFIPGKLISY